MVLLEARRCPERKGKGFNVVAACGEASIESLGKKGTSASLYPLH